MPKPKNISSRSKRGNGNFQAASRGGGGRRSGNGHGNGNGNASFVPFEGTANAFTLQEEARNTDRNGAAFWNTDQRLRDSKISFVSAGKFEPTKLDVNEAALAHLNLASTQVHSEEEEAAEAQQEEEEEEYEVDEEEVEAKVEQFEVIVEEEAGEEAAESSSIKTPNEAETSIFVIDTAGSGPVHTGMAFPRVRSASPTPSDSSEEVILFCGRDQQGRALSRAPLPSKLPQASVPPTDSFDAKIRVVENRIELLKEELQHDQTPYSSVLHPSTESSRADFEAILPPNPVNKTHRGYRNKNAFKKSEEDEIMADYIANMDGEDVVFPSFSQRALGGEDGEVWQDTEASSGEAIGESSKPSQGGWNRSDIEDLDDLSTSDGVTGEVQDILSKRERVSGTQYLVVWEHQSTDDARWVPMTTLTSVAAMMHVEKFEVKEKLVAQFEGSEEEDTSDSDEIDPAIDRDDNDDQDLIQMKIDQMSDEKIARLLSKQEELGMGSDEILLLDAYEEDASEVNDTSFAKSAYHAAIAARQMKSLRGPSRARGEFPSATLLADAYDGFDVMDYDRPSLQKRSKARKGKLVMENSDSELEARMQKAWSNDRLKKKEKKQQREELRAQGLLGSKDDKVDLKQRYKEGMSIEDVKEQIKGFLRGIDTTIVLPPMDKADRKIVHELANFFSLKSKSAGGGNKRFPILYKTIRTRNFNTDSGAIDAMYAKLSRRYLPRMDVSGKRAGGEGGGFGKRSGGGFHNHAAAQYRNGDIVGGSAPELGAENRGRAMLEKMGWTKGTALGSENNKGILQPVSHVVKTGKAGLG